MPQTAQPEEEVVKDGRITFFQNIIIRTFAVREDKWEKFITTEDNQKTLLKLFDKAALDKIFFLLSSTGTISISIDFPQNLKSTVKCFYFLKNNPEDVLLINATTKEIKNSFGYGEFDGNCLVELPIFIEKVAISLLTNEKNCEEWPISTQIDIKKNITKLERELKIFLGKSQNEIVLPIPELIDDDSGNSKGKMTSEELRLKQICFLLLLSITIFGIMK